MGFCNLRLIFSILIQCVNTAKQTSSRKEKNQNDDCNIFTCAELRTAELMILTYLQTFF